MFSGLIIMIIIQIRKAPILRLKTSNNTMDLNNVRMYNEVNLVNTTSVDNKKLS